MIIQVLEAVGLFFGVSLVLGLLFLFDDACDWLFMAIVVLVIVAVVTPIAG